MVTEQEVEAIGQTLGDPQQPLQARFRALFTLRGLGGPDAIAWISRAFRDDSALLKHELAYCLGQMQDRRAIPVLVEVLRDTHQEPMVRHEAGEALGAIGDPEVLDILKQYSADPVVEVAETCQLAVCRLEWLQQHSGEPAAAGPYLSVDPAPPAKERDVGRLREALLDEALPLFDRYRAMFALRDAGGEEAALALAEASLTAPHSQQLLCSLPQAFTVAAPSSAMRSATFSASCSMRRLCPSWLRPWPRGPRAPWCDMSARRPWEPLPAPPAWLPCGPTWPTPSAWCGRAARWPWTCTSMRGGRPSSTRTGWSRCARPPPRATAGAST
ncbi:deoxyhypusine hydroxylase isoform X1 [Myotis myotis]|uniref:deoxyhypusine hydroxylase isoform X1 n=1 Tax=Myotis myotis TaxID=51298 RepID=UPI00174AF439|nr:deoxyhypusine hydroxylase isoform X1 [Myotis myotis]XP_036169351.1 deoxyhypusine hydroxylase isoform X1 [Myotis myotis]